MKPYPLYEVETINNLKELIDYCAEKYGDKTAFCWLRGEETFKVSFNKFKVDVSALGAFFIESGFNNEKIAVTGENSYEWIVTFFAAVNSGNVIVPIDKELNANQVSKLLNFVGAKVLVYSDQISDEIDSVKLNTTIELCLNIKTDVPGILSQGAGNPTIEFNNSSVTGATLCAIVYTSGTTGHFKCVMLSHGNLMGNTLNTSRNFLTKNPILLFLPLSHTYSLTLGLLYPLFHGSINFINEKLTNISNELIEFRPHAMIAVPLFIENMHNRIWDAAKKKKKDKQLRVLMRVSNTLLIFKIDLRRRLFKSVLDASGGNLSIIISGGAPIDVKLIKEFRSFGIEIYNGYGITECSPVVSTNRNQYYKDGSVGTVIPNCEVKIIDGEVCVKGDSVMLGYYKDPQATQETFCDGWFKTGDLGYLDKDGFLYITGRKKNIIVLSSGFNVSPEELEECIKGIPTVVEVLVYQGDNKIVAEIYPDLTIANVQHSIKKSIEELNATLTKHKRIGEVKFRATEFEKTSTKKIKRNIGGKITP